MKVQNFTKFASAALLSTALSTAMFVASPVAYADDHAKCQHKIEKAEAKLDDAIRKHGDRSSQAEKRRRDLNAEREHCWNSYHGWWDGHEHRWHDSRDWEDHH
jgi:septal ring factor EnvC (AmiA/AmiB activator)